MRRSLDAASRAGLAPQSGCCVGFRFTGPVLWGVSPELVIAIPVKH